MSEIRTDYIKDKSGAYTATVSKLAVISGTPTTGQIAVFGSTTNTIEEGYGVTVTITSATTTLATSKAIKDYVDANVLGGQNVAWVNFKTTSGTTIYDSSGVSSIADSGIGDQTIYFSTTASGYYAGVGMTERETNMCSYGIAGSLNHRIALVTHDDHTNFADSDACNYIAFSD